MQVIALCKDTAIAMTDAELLNRLIGEGCLVGTNGGGLRDVAFGGLIDGACWWVELSPEDQHHTHCTPYIRTQQYHDRDLAFYGDNEELVLYFAPYTEWPELDVDRHLKAWSRWRVELKSPGNHERLTRFVQNCLRMQIEL